MKIFNQLTAVGLLVGLACGSALAAKEVSLVDGGVKMVASSYGGGCSSARKTYSVNGMLIDGPSVYSWSGNNLWATWDIRGYDYFKGTIGIPDDQGSDSSGTVTFEVNGEVIKRVSQKSNQSATDVSIALSGKGSLTIRWDGSQVYVINPVLIKGSPVPAASYRCSICQAEFHTQADFDIHTREAHGTKPPPNTGAAFVVEPKDIDALAQQLRDKVNTKPALKSKLEKAKIAIADFDLVDIPSKSVSKNVADDLYTALIDRDFNLVERGQISKILEELKIQSSGMIDPMTAKKIGQVSGCDMILLGSISDRGQFLVVNARLMETETGSAVVAQKIEMRKVSISR